MSTNLIFPKFKQNKVSTKTFTAMTTLNINIKSLFEILPVTPYIVIPKKRGRKKKCENVNLNKGILHGSIVTIEFEDKLKGVRIKPKKNKKKKKWFRNSITIVILLDKFINFKVCKNGTFQMTGCKSLHHAEQCVKYLWDYIKDYPEAYEFVRKDYLEALFIPSMKNIDFSLGFIVDREKLNQYMIKQKEFRCLLETSFGYTGVNIKIPITKDITKMNIKKNYYKDGKWETSWTTYKEYINLLPQKIQKNKLHNTHYNTFLVFQSGNVIMSGLTSEFMEDIYYYFLDMIKDSYNEIEERLLPPLY